MKISLKAHKGLSIVSILLIIKFLVVSSTAFITWYTGRTQGDEIADDVTLDGYPLGGKTASQVRTLLNEAAKQLYLPPLDYQVIDHEEYVVPARWGWRLNADEIIRRLKRAPPGSRLQTEWSIIPPKKPTPQPPQYPVRAAAEGLDAVGFMINVAWGEQHLDGLLEVLSVHDASATFFIMGEWAKANPHWIQRLSEMGHQVAAHGHQDKHPADYSRKQFAEDLKENKEFLKKHTNYAPQLYTPHYGELTSFMIEEAHAVNLTTILWTTDTADWLYDDPKSMMDRVRPNISDGALILMHPTENTADFLKKLFAYLKDQGLKGETCEKLLSPLPPVPDDLFKMLEQLHNTAE